MTTLPVSIREARTLGVPRYFTGKPCKHGHVAERFAANGSCAECVNARQVAKYHADREAARSKQREYRHSRIERTRELRRLSYVRHRDKQMANNREWCQRNPERKRDLHRAFYARHRQTLLARRRENYQENAATCTARVREWRKRNPERARRIDAVKYAKNGALIRARVAHHAKRHRDKSREYSRRRSVRVRAAGSLAGHHTRTEWAALVAAHGGRCVYCGSTHRIVRDHVVPLSRGGDDTIDNIQPLCFSCNCRKSNKTHEEYMAYRAAVGGALPADTLPRP